MGIFSVRPRTLAASAFPALAVALTLGLSAGPAAPQGGGQADGQSADEIRRFCGNIVDAARDRRYAMQEAELKKLQQDVDDRLKRLEEKRAEYQDWLTRRNDFLAKAEGNLVEIYSRMRPDAAAERLAEVNVELAAGILMKLQARQAGIILNEMDSKAAATLTGIMASAARRQDPT